MYRLKTDTGTSSQHAIEPVTTPRSPGSRDGHGSKFHLADFGGFFGKRAREREREREREEDRR